jgi:hypothetical protein
VGDLAALNEAFSEGEGLAYEEAAFGNHPGALGDFDKDFLFLERDLGIFALRIHTIYIIIPSYLN